MKNFLILTCLALTFGWANAAHAVTMDFAFVGNAGNAGDVQSLRTFGAVAYNYAISKTEVTNAQYTEFLNGVAATDSFGLYNSNMGSSTQAGITRSGSSGSYTYAVKADAAGAGPGGADYTYADKPVIYVSWYDSVRFTNWLHNGQGTGDTETGAYTLLGGTATPTNGLSITRNTDAAYWLPSVDEWYKAAHHDASAGLVGTYFDYATGTDTVPDNNLPSADIGNSANYNNNGSPTHNFTYPLTDVGAYALTESPYGTHDQNGNVSEWNETLLNSSLRGRQGGAWELIAITLAAPSAVASSPATEDFSLGFRVATVPEPIVSLVADYNGNGIVDAADYTVWKDSFGSTVNLAADGDGSGTIDAGDYTEWVNHFGESSALSATVPEPTSLLLLVGLAGGILVGRRR